MTNRTENSYGTEKKFTLENNDTMPRFDRSVSLICWAYNEEKLIQNYLFRVVELLEQNVVDYEIVVIDDGSRDKTNEIVREVAKTNPRIKLFTNETNRNVGYSCMRAIKEASKEYLFWQTIDWSYDIRMLRTFLELLNDYDVVAGVRHTPAQQKGMVSSTLASFFMLFGHHLTKRSDNLPKAIVSVCNYIIIRILYRLPMSDYQNVVFYRTSFVHSIIVESDSSFVNPEILLKSYWKGARIMEVPISFLPRTQGEAKGTKLSSIYKSIKDVFGFWMKWVVLKARGKVNKGEVRRLNPSQWEKI